MRKSPVLTYGKLDRFLKKLGFERLDGDGYFIYRHTNGAEIMLPDAGSATPAYPWHVVAVRQMLEWNGFEKMTHEISS